jgi:cytochrome c5
MRRILRALVIAVGLVGVVVVVVTFAQSGSPEGSARTRIWDGVFTPAQVQRGRAAFTTSCVRCHALDAQGVPFRMSGEPFWNNWADDPLEVMFSRIRSSMPNNAPGTLDDQTYADLVAFILSVNGVPATGTTDLTPTAMPAIQMVRREGPRPVPEGALVNVVGCLVQSGRVWIVESASEPMRSRARGLDADLARAEQLSAADRTYELKFALVPLGAMRGQRVVARGLLMRDPDAINVEAVRSLGRPCAR